MRSTDIVQHVPAMYILMDLLPKLLGCIHLNSTCMLVAAFLLCHSFGRCKEYVWKTCRTTKMSFNSLDKEVERYLKKKKKTEKLI